MKSPKLLVSALVVASVGATQAQTYTSVQIDATDNLSGAGNPSNTTPNPGGGSGGTAASGYSLDPGLGRVLTFQSVSGIISLSSPVVSTNADGVDPVNGTADLFPEF
ncbi:MAG: hypothetical protein K1X67_14320 [Fimbriimonadaceae bacterium]|nr:hypothetical protein [Fimbriimonadaceae bacterium]